jgi:hypothetical protein
LGDEKVYWVKRMTGGVEVSGRLVWSVSDGLRMITSGVGGARLVPAGDPGPSANYVALCVCVAPCPATYKLKVELPIPHTARRCRCNTLSDSCMGLFHVTKHVDVGNSFVNHIFSKQISGGGRWCMLLGTVYLIVPMWTIDNLSM